MAPRTRRTASSRPLSALVASRLASWRAKAGVTVRELSERTGISELRLYRKMGGRGSEFSIDEAASVARALELPEWAPFVEDDVLDAVTAGRKA